MYGVLGEDKSDFETLKILVQRLVGKRRFVFRVRDIPVVASC